MSLSYELLKDFTPSGGARLLSFDVTPSGTPQAIVIGVHQNTRPFSNTALQKDGGVAVVTYGDRLYVAERTTVPDDAQTGGGTETACVGLFYVETEQGIPPGTQKVRAYMPSPSSNLYVWCVAIYNSGGWLENTDTQKRDSSSSPGTWLGLAASVASIMVVAMSSKANDLTAYTPLTDCIRPGSGLDWGSQVADFLTCDERSTGLTAGWAPSGNDDAIVGYTFSHVAAGALLEGRIPFIAADGQAASQINIPGTEGVSSDPDAEDGVWMPGGPGIGDLVKVIAVNRGGGGAVAAKSGWTRELDTTLGGSRIVVEWKWLEAGDTQTADYSGDGITDVWAYVVKGSDLHKTSPIGNITTTSGGDSTFTVPANTGDDESGRGSHFVTLVVDLDTGPGELKEARPTYGIGISYGFSSDNGNLGHTALRTASYAGGTVGPTGSGIDSYLALTIELQSKVLTPATKIVLEDPGGGAGPVQIDEEFVANGLSGQKQVSEHYLRAIDATFHEILKSERTSEAQSTIWVDGNQTAKFSLDDLVSIHPDSLGTLLHRLFSPRIADFGRVAREKNLDDITGRGQYAQNPLFEDWASQGDSYAAQVDGDHTGSPTSLTVKNGPANKSVAAGTQILFTYQDIVGPTAIHVVRIVDSPGATLDGSGAGSIPLTEAMPTSPLITDDAPAMLCVSALPDNWSPSTGLVFPSFNFYRPTSVTSQITGLSTMDASTDAAAGYGGFLRLSGGTAGVTKIYAGDSIDINGLTRVALHDAVADASGNLYVVLNLRGTWSASVSVTVTRPQFLAAYGDAVIMTPSFFQQDYVESPSSLVPFIAASPKLWFSHWGTVWNPTSSAIEVNPEDIYKKKPKVALWDGSSEVAELDYSEPDADFGKFTVAAGAEYNFLIRQAHNMTVTDSFSVRPYATWLSQAPGTGGSITQRALLWTYHRAVELSIATTIGDDETDPVRGFPANLLHQDANRMLLAHHGWEPEITLEYDELLDASGMSPDQVRVVKRGQAFRAQSPAKNLDAVYTVQRIHWEVRDEEMIPSFVLGLRQELLTEQIARGSVSTATAISRVASNASSSSSSSVDAYTKSEADSLHASAVKRNAHRVLVGF